MNPNIKGNRKIKTYLLVLVGLVPPLFILAVFSGIRFESIIPRISDEDVKLTESNCSNLVIPKSFVKVRDYNIVKINSAFFTTQYKSSVDPKIINDFFADQLIPQGWELQSKRNGGTVEQRFYKGKFSISIVYGNLSFTSDRTYSVGCSWKTTRNGIIGDLFE